MVKGTIREIFKYDYLPGNSVAREFADHDFTTQLCLWKYDTYKGETELMLWFFEEKVKEAYEEFISVICQVTQTFLLPQRSEIRL